MARGLAEGAVLRCGGARPAGPGYDEGFYYLPTVLDECTSAMSVVQEESFGPVLTVERFTGEEEAVRLADDTVYGLAGAVWTGDEAYGGTGRGAAAARHGLDQRLPPSTCRRPSGVVTSSPGSGANSDPGLAEYRETKHIWRNTAPAPQGWFDDSQAAHDDHRAIARPTPPRRRRTRRVRLQARTRRTLGHFHTFAAGISYISILTGTFQLFYFGYGSGGPAYWWSWPMVFVGQFTVALCFAELAARYPVAGSVYNWSKKIGNPHLGWLAGWTMLIASIVSISAVALAYQLTLPQISRFQFVGDGTGTYDVATNAVVLAAVLILFTTLVNAFGGKLMATINTAGVFIELIATVVLIILFAVHITRGPQVVMQTNHTGAGYSTGYLGAFLVASLASAYVMYGFDTASSLGQDHPEGVIMWEAEQPMTTTSSQWWEAGVFYDTEPGLDRPDLMFHYGSVPFDMNTARWGYPDLGERVLPHPQRDEGEVAGHGTAADAGLPGQAEGGPALLHGTGSTTCG
ncbi:NAD/NADP-dependent betaine aldehyde dehydrogenase [Streptomyces canarius]